MTWEHVEEDQACNDSRSDLKRERERERKAKGDSFLGLMLECEIKVQPANIRKNAKNV